MRKETDLVHWYEADTEKSEGEKPTNAKDVKEKQPYAQKTSRQWKCT